MATILAVYNSEGCVGRCDANCYDAVGPECDCICGGKNHGAGKQQAVDNNREMIGLKPEDLERFAKAHGLDQKDLVVVDRTKAKARRAAKTAKRELRQREWAAKHPQTKVEDDEDYVG